MKKIFVTTLILFLLKVQSNSTPSNSSITNKKFSNEMEVFSNQVLKNKGGRKVKNNKNDAKNKNAINSKGKKTSVAARKKDSTIPPKRPNFNTDSPMDKLIEKEKETY